MVEVVETVTQSSGFECDSMDGGMAGRQAIIRWGEDFPGKLELIEVSVNQV